MARTVRNPESRTRIIDAAWRLVASDGVHGATMRTIASAAGVTTGFVTHYFEDKNELLAEVLRFNNLRARDRIVAAVGSKRGLVALESAVEAMLPIDADRRREWQVGIACWGPTSPGEQAAGVLRNGWRFLETMFAELLQQAVDDGELHEDIDIAYEASRFVTLLAGVGMLAGIESAKHVRRDAKRMLTDQISHLDSGRVDLEELAR